MTEEQLQQILKERDISIFSKIHSQTSENDKRSLLLIQELVREQSSEYVYLEIGSHLGGTIQPHLLDNHCKAIYSIDKRPPFQPDERSQVFEYKENSTSRMLRKLRYEYPNQNVDKIVTIDKGTEEVSKEEIPVCADLFLIDGEHTNRAAYKDFVFCMSVRPDNCIIVFHDANLIFKTINKVISTLTRDEVKNSGYLLADNVYAFVIGEFPDSVHETLKANEKSKEKEFLTYENKLNEMKASQPIGKKLINFWYTYVVKTRGK